jgi:hypothetical protein
MAEQWESLFEQALAEWRTALDGFNYADGEFIDYQILKLYAAEQKLALILRQLKSGRGLARARQLAGGRLPALTAPLGQTEQLLQAPGAGTADGHLGASAPSADEPRPVEEGEHLRNLV